MLIRYSKNPFYQVAGILFYNWGRILVFAIWATIVYCCYDMLGFKNIGLPVVPVSILGGALAIFLAFRNGSSYDRWWEARKIWGAIVNTSRTFGMQVMAYGSLKFSNDTLHEADVLHWQKEMIYRHIAWLSALRTHLIKKADWSEVAEFIEKEEYERLMECANKPVQLLNMQGQWIKQAREKGVIEDFRQFELTKTIGALYDHQGKAERIKNTVFPFYYNYFTRMFLWLFVLCLPFSLVETMGITLIPMSIAISFVFSILEKAGKATEDPFEGNASDTPIDAISKAIEIDLRDMLGEKSLPDPEPIRKGRFGVLFQR